MRRSKPPAWHQRLAAEGGVVENPQIVRALIDAWNRRDVDGFRELLAEDVEWVEIGGRPERSRAGRETVQAGLESLFDAWEQYRLEPEALHEAGDRVVMIACEVARGRASGLELQDRWGYLITLRGGKLSRVEAYRDPRRALEAAGLSKGDLHADPA
jgi:ketosteroid isomerase-like protein